MTPSPKMSSPSMMMSPTLIADAEDDAQVLGHPRIAADHAALNHDRAPDRIDDAGKFDESAVACSLDDTAMMSGNRRVNQLAAMGFQCV